MRAILAVMLLIAVPSAAQAPQSYAQLDVPRNRGAQQVLAQTREFAPGSESGWHVHPGTEIGYVISGEVELLIPGSTRRLQIGDSFTIPRGVAHNGRNPGQVPAQLVITLVLDKGAQPRQPVAAPRG